MLDILKNFLYDILPTLSLALIVLVLGLIVSKILVKLLGRALSKTKLDLTIRSFFKSLVKVFLYIIIIVTFLSILNVPMSSIIAVIGAAGLSIGLALQSTISNLAGGFIVLFVQPFKVGDYIQFGDNAGTVSSISIFNTKLLTIDNKAIFVPNGQISNSSLINYSAEPKRRLDLVYSISYESDFKKAKIILSDIVDSHPFSLKDPAPVIRVIEHAANSINITVRVWVKAEHYFDLLFDLNEEVKIQFDKQGIVIPYNQLDVFIKK